MKIILCLLLAVQAVAQTGPPAPPSPQVPKTVTPYSSEYRRMLSSRTVKPATMTPLIIGKGLTIAGLTVLSASGTVSLIWSGSTNTVQLQCSQNGADWRNVGYPTLNNPITCAMQGPCAMFRLQEVTNQINLGNYYVGSLFAATNGLGSSAMVLYDSSSQKLVMWDRSKHVTQYTIPNFDVTDVGVSCELAFANGHLIIARVNANSLLLKVTEYAFNGGQLTIVTNITTGNANCRWVDAITLRNGQVNIACYEQTNDMAGWFLHRTPQGKWVDDKEQVVVTTGQYGAGIMRQCERPSDGASFLFGNKDGGQYVWSSQIGYIPSFHVITNVGLANDSQTSICCPDRVWFNDTNMAPHPEYLAQLKAVPDWDTGGMLVCYPNIMGGAVFDANGQHYIVTDLVEILTDGFTKSQITVTPKKTERVFGGICIADGIYYCPMASNTVPYYPLVKFTTNSTLIAPIYYPNNVYQSRGYDDAILVRDDGAVIIALYY